MKKFLLTAIMLIGIFVCASAASAREPICARTRYEKLTFKENQMRKIELQKDFVKKAVKTIKAIEKKYIETKKETEEPERPVFGRHNIRTPLFGNMPKIQEDEKYVLRAMPGIKDDEKYVAPFTTGRPGKIATMVLGILKSISPEEELGGKIIVTPTDEVWKYVPGESNAMIRH